MLSSSRNGAKVRLIAVHTTEGIMKARDLIAFFNRADAGGSSHAGADNTGALLGPEAGYVPYDRAAWTLRNGNPVSDNLEYCGWARYTRQQWLTTEAKGLEAIAQWIAQRCRARNVPPVKLSPADVRAGKSGVIGHVDWTNGMNDGTHWDPGPDFPWDVVMARVEQILGGSTAAAITVEDDMFEGTDRSVAADRHSQLVSEMGAQRGVLASMDAKLDRIAAALEKLGGAGGLDAAAAEVAGAAGGKAALRELGDVLAPR